MRRYTLTPMGPNDPPIEPSLEPLGNGEYEIQFTVDVDTLVEIHRIQALLSEMGVYADLPRVLELALAEARRHPDALKAAVWRRKNPDEPSPA